MRVSFFALALVACGSDGSQPPDLSALTEMGEGIDAAWGYDLSVSDFAAIDCANIIDAACVFDADLCRDLAVATPPLCGVLGKPCCPDQVCSDETTCSGSPPGTCVPCGAPGECQIGCGYEGKNCCVLYGGCSPGLDCFGVGFNGTRAMQIKFSYCIIPKNCGAQGQACCGTDGNPVNNNHLPGVCPVGLRCNGFTCNQ